MGDFTPSQQQSTLTQNDFSTNRGVTKFKTVLDIESYYIASIHKPNMLSSRATVSRGSADKQIGTEFKLSEFTTDIPNEYVEALNSNSDPDFETPKHKKAYNKRSSSLTKNIQPVESRKRGIHLVNQSKTYPSSTHKMSNINANLRENIDEYYSQVQQLKRQVRMQENQLDYLLIEIHLHQ